MEEPTTFPKGGRTHTEPSDSAVLRRWRLEFREAKEVASCGEEIQKGWTIQRKTSKNHQEVLLSFAK